MKLKQSLVLRACGVAALVVSLISHGGCGKAPDEGTVSVNGTVTLDGKPVDKAAIAFIGKEGARLATAQTDNAGKFTIRASLGKNVVTVAKPSSNPNPPPPSNEPQLMPTDGEYRAMREAVKAEFPSKYGDPKTSGISFDVNEKTKDLEVSLTSK